MTPHLSDAQIRAYLWDGKRDVVTQQHLAECDACCANVSQLEQLEQRLGQILYRAHCFSAETLNEYDLNELPADEMQQIQLHLETCEHCSAELADLKAAVAAFPQPQPSKPSIASPRIVTYIAEALSSLAHVTMAPVGAGVSTRQSSRSKEAQPSGQSGNHYTYMVTVESLIPITIEVKPDEQIGRYQIIGDGAFDSMDSMQVALWREGQSAPIQTNMMNDLGEFQFTNVTDGRYEIILSSQLIEVYLRNVVIG